MSIRRPHRFDASIAAAGLLGGLLLWLVGLHTQTDAPLRGPWVLLPLTVVAALELCRRDRPLLVFALGTALAVADQCTTGSLATLVMYTDLVYASVLYGSPALARRIPLGTGLFTLVVALGFLAWLRQAQALMIAVPIGVLTFGPAATGALVRNHREAARTARREAAQHLRLAEQSARLAELDRAQAVAAERARMARELHDMVANRLTAIAIHSTAALSLDDPGSSRQSLGVIRENSVAGLTEMRGMIGLLREREDGEPLAVPTLDGLSALVAQARANGLEVALRTVPDTADARPPVPAPVELAAYRIAQECLTNALKHAAPGPVEVRLTHRPDALTVRVTSCLTDGHPVSRAPGSGAGLIGMRERAALLHGEFRAGPVEQGRCWEVRAVLPLTTAPPLEDPR
ncbi:histidine kinase [Kitasatospora viridis]|uniref:histidine kinase n=1 Tax=Kitasatospora viridis TaxID=281105 RepID=A0A561UGR4_9ACTN|nr:signal transduction histidine kinase [Kitasatospora viridis]